LEGGFKPMKIPGGKVSVNSTTKIPETELGFTYSRAGGPGGQNVNKVETRVQLTFDLLRSPSLEESQKELLLRGLGRRIGPDGVIRVVVDESRSQHRNRELAVERLASLIRSGLTPQKKRIPTKKTAASKARRRESKRITGERKKLRKSINRNDL